jgi:hypothetical protein
LLLAIFSVHGVRADGLERLKYNNPGLTVDFGVGLWAAAYLRVVNPGDISGCRSGSRNKKTDR